MLQIALVFAVILPSFQGKSLFFMYDLPETFWWRWPIRSSDCSGNGYLGHEHAELSGYGTLN